MIRTKASSIAVGCSLLVACSSAPTSTPNESGVLGQTAEELTDLPSTVDESALDRTADPCSDFYQFACGGFIKGVNVPPAGSRSRAFTGEARADRDALTEIVAKAQKRATAEDRKVAGYDAACVAFNAGRAPGALAAALAPELARLHTGGGESAVLGRALRSTANAGAAWGYLQAVQPILNVYPAPDRDGDYRVVALHVEPSFVWDTDPSVVGPVLDDNYPGLTQAQRDSLTGLVVATDTALSNAVMPFANVHDYNPIGRDGLAKAMPHLDVDALLEGFGTPGARHVVLWNLKALQAIDGVLATLSPADLDRYLDYKTVEGWWNVDAPSPTADDASLACLYETAASLSAIVEHRFVDTLMGKKNTKVAMAMAKSELATFAKRLETTPFLDDATRAEAIKKAKEMTITPLLEPRDRYTGITLGAKAEDFVPDQIALHAHEADTQIRQIDHKPGATLDMASSFDYVNSFYDPTSNRFTILPGLAHGTFFGGSKAPAAHNFGALGWVIGHEMTHGFDNDGRLYDGHGADRNWWTPAAEAAFNQRAQCFIDEYSGFAVDGVVDPATGQIAHVNGAQTLGENIADNGGIRTAYQTAEPYFARGKSDAGFTPAQQFFVAAGQMWCEKRGAVNALNQLRTDVHSPGKARIIETLSNFDKFAEAFQCSAESKMVAKPACAIW